MSERLVRYYFWAISLGVLLARSLPVRIREPYIKYGKTYREAKDNRSLILQPARFRVPKSWFYHFYAICLIWSTIWIAKLARAEPSQKRVFLPLLLLLVQSVRRLYECLNVQPRTSAQIWLGHYLIGVSYYTILPFAIFSNCATDLLPTDLQISIGLGLFVISSYTQYQCHKYLASLPKYTLPTKALFSDILCPHYMAETGIYVSLFVLLPSADLFANLVWVIVDLAIAAESSSNWYQQQFGKRVTQRWVMLPFLY